MSDNTQMAGKVVTLWRYPIKSMLGEELNATEVTTRGLLGDRAYALVDQATSNVASARNPRKWPHLFDFRAAFAVPPCPGMPLPAVRITLPDGRVLTTDQSEINQLLSQALQREVTLEAAERGQQEGVASLSPTRLSAKAEEYWPDMEGLDFRDTVTDFALPQGTFFDCATVHLLTTATAGPVSSRALRGTPLSSQYRRADRKPREGLRGGCLDWPHTRHRRCGAPRDHRPVPPLCDDDAASSRLAR
jgi:hypothetical protein